MDNRLELYHQLVRDQDTISAISEMNKLRRIYPLDFKILIHWFELALSLKNNKVVLSYAEELKKHKLNSSAEICLIEFERQAFFQSRNYEKAFDLLIKQIKKVGEDENNIFLEINKTKKIDRDKALRLMIELLSNMAEINIPITVQGGTLLGLIRENNILEHDKDLDFCVDIKNLKKVIDYMDKVKMRRSYKDDVFNNFATYLDPKTGITIDIMGLRFNNNNVIGGYFESNGNKEWSRELLYPNHKLVKERIFEKEIYMPSNPEMILQSEYGDWKTPNTNWITFLDAPNLISNTKLNTYYILIHLLNFKIRNEFEKIERIRRELKILGMPTHLINEIC